MNIKQASQLPSIHRLILLCLMLCYCGEFFAQPDHPQSKLDSIQSEINEAKGSLKVNAYINAWEYANNLDKKQALQWAREGMRFASDMNNHKGAATLSWQAGLTYQNLGKYDSARYFIDRSLQIAESHHLTESMLVAQYRLGSLFYRIGKTDSARILFNNTLIASKATSFPDAEILANGGLGKIAQREGEYDQALIYFMREAELGRDLNMPNSIAHALLNMGIIYGKIHDYQRAKQVNKQAMEIAVKYGYTDRVFQLNNNLAVIYRLMGIYDSSLLYQQQCLDIAYERSSQVDITRAFMNFGTTYAYQKKYETAKMYYDTAYEWVLGFDNLPLRMSILQNLSAVSKDMGQYHHAIQYARQALSLARKTNQKQNFLDLYETFYSSWKALNNIDSSLFYHELMYKYHDSLYNERKQKNIDEIKIKYESKKMESEYLVLENKNLENTIELSNKKLQLNIVLGTGFTLLVVIILLWVIFRIKYLKDVIIRQQKFDQLTKEQEILAAQSLIEGQEEERKRISQELHDGLGVLLTTASMQISELSDSASTKKQGKMIAKAVDLLREAGNELRKISHNMMPGVLSNFGLFDALEDLMEEIGETGSIDVQFTLQGSKSRLDAQHEIMIYRITQELVNNTIRYAQASNISIHLQRFSDSLSIDYSDNGKGFDIRQQKETKSLGLSGIRSRVDLLHGKVEFLSSEGNGFNCHIEIPL